MTQLNTEKQQSKKETKLMLPKNKQSLNKNRSPQNISSKIPLIKKGNAQTFDNTSRTESTKPSNNGI